MFGLGFLIGLAASLVLIRPTDAQAPTQPNQDYKNETKAPPTNISGGGTDNRPSTRKSVSSVSGRHNIRAEKAISVETLRKYLQEQGSPLADYSDQILHSPYWSTIIGICTIEQYNCTKAPGFNYWGLMGKNGLQKFANMEQGISAIDAFLAHAEANKHPTVESMRGWYCSSACTNWEPTVIKTKIKLESL